MNAQLLPTLILVMALGLVLILLFAMCTLIWHKLEQIESVLYEKNIKFDPNAKVIMITAAGQKEKMVEAVKFGATEFIAKPFLEESVLTALEHC